MVAGELNNFILVWTTTVASLCYCHIISKLLTKSSISCRLLYFLPINLLFLVLPLKLSSIFLGGTTCFLIAWLTNFKLILFAFKKGPLFSNPTIPLPQFIVVACFPITVRESVENISSSSENTPIFSLMHFITTRMIAIAILIRTLHYIEYFHPFIMQSFHSVRIALALEMLLTLLTALATSLLLLLPRGVELEPPFDNFFLSTSVQNYWGKRWNRVVSGLLKLTVYKPMRSVSARFITIKWASIPAVLVTFAVSGLMHELVLYNFAKVKPSGHFMCFFLLNGVAVSVEIVMKKKFGGKFHVPRMICWPLTMAFMSCSSSFLVIPSVSAAMADHRTCREGMAFLEFVFTGRLVPQADLHCPFF